MEKKLIVKKIIIQIIGLLFCGLGIAAMAISGAGASPLDAASNYAWVLTGIFKQGTWLFIFNAIFTAVLFAITRKYKVLITLVMSFLMGFFVNGGISFLTLFIKNVDFFGNYETIMSIYGTAASGGISVTGMLYSYGVAAFGTVCLSAGIGFILAHNLFLTPYDEVSLYLETKIGNYAISKVVTDGTVLIIAVILGLLIKDVFSQLNVFSVVAVFTLGPLIGMFRKIFSKGEKKDEIEQVY